MEKRFFKHFFMLCLFGMISIGVNATTSGSYWSLNTSTGELVITGNIPDFYQAEDQPWYSNHSSIIKVTIKSSCNSIGYCAFHSCYNLKTIRIEDTSSALTIRSPHDFCSSCDDWDYDGVFDNCPIESIYVGRPIKSQREYGQGSLNVEAITAAWQGQGNTHINNVSSIVFGEYTPESNLDLINTYPNLKSVSLNNNSDYVILNDVLYNANKTTLIRVMPYKSSDYFVIPSTVTTISSNAFNNCSKLVSVTIPEKVSSISGRAFEGCDNLSDLSVNSANTSLDSREGCNAIIETATNTLIVGTSNTIIPNTVTKIGNSAFWYCKNLNSIDIPKSVTSISEYSFEHCSALKDIYVHWSTPINITPYYVFGSVNLSDITLHVPYGKDLVYEKSSSWNSFGRIIALDPETIACTSISLNKTGCIMELGESVTLIESVLPDNATDKSVTWSSDNEGVATVVDGVVTAVAVGTANITATTNDGSNLNSNCKILVGQASIPNNQIWYTSTDGNVISPYDSQAFGGATIRSNENSNGIGIITFDKNVTSIGNATFYRCTNLDRLIIPSSISSFGDYAFQQCSNLTGLTIPSNVKSIGKNAFGGCSRLATICVDNANTIFDSRYDCNAIIETATNTLIVGCMNTTIPSSVTNIGSCAFDECKSLTKVTIPSSVKSIEICAFRSCSNLVTINVDNVNTIYDSRSDCNAIIETATNTLIAGCKNTIIPSSVTAIEEYAFFGLSSLDKLAIPSSVKSIGTYAFGFSNLTELTIPRSVTSIGNNAFNYCSNLTDVYVEWESPLLLFGSVFGNSKATLHVPYGTKSLYEAAYYWKDFGTIIEMEPETIVCTSISLTPTTENITVGETATLTATVLPEDAEDKSMTWSSDNESVATVADGVVTAVATGTANITAKTNDGSNLSATCAVTVNPKTINVASVAITPTTANLKVGDAETLTLTALPEDATDKSVTWSSDNEGVATVVDGVVTAVAAGTANITAKTNDGSNLSATCVVTVTSKSSGDDPSEDIEPSTDISKFTNVLYINDVEARQGTELSLPLNMKNAEEDITAFECKVYLPAGVEWAYTIDKRGNKIFVQPTFNEERTDANYHTINSIKQMEDGSYYVIVYSDKKEIILDKDGAILYMPLTVSEEIEPGDYNIFVKDIVMVNENTEQVLISKTISKLTIPAYTLGDANDDGMINITDVVAVISYMLKESPNPFIFKAADVNGDEMINVTDVVGIIDIMTSGASSAKPEMAMAKKAVKKSAKTGNSLEIVPFTVAAGTTSMNVALELNNPGDEFTALECKVFLPEGVDWDYTIDRRGNKIYKQPTFNEDRTDANYHTINSISKVDGGYYVIVYSDKKEIFLDEDGALLYLPLVFDENINPGVYDIRVGDIVLARPDVTQELLDDYTASVLVGSPEIASLSLNGDFTADAIAEYNTALASNTKVAAMDFSNATDVDAMTAIATGNRNLLVYVAEGKNVKNENNAVIGDACTNLVLTDGYSFCAPKAFTAAKASYTRTAPSGYATICLPFAPSTDGITFYELKSDDEKSLTFSCVESPVANAPYLYKATKDVMTASNVEVNADGAGSLNKGDWTMTGTYTSREFNAMDNVFAMSNGTLYRNTGTLTVNPFRAYFTTSGTAAKAEIFIETPTGIENIVPSNSESNDALFNIQGIMVNKDYRGIKISQGKKHLNK